MSKNFIHQDKISYANSADPDQTAAEGAASVIICHFTAIFTHNALNNWAQVAVQLVLLNSDHEAPGLNPLEVKFS